MVDTKKEERMQQKFLIWLVLLKYTFWLCRIVRKIDLSLMCTFHGVLKCFLLRHSKCNSVDLDIFYFSGRCITFSLWFSHRPFHEYYDECIYWHSVRVQAEYVRSVVFRVTMGHLIMQLLQYLLLWDFTVIWITLQYSILQYNPIQYRSLYNTNNIYMLYSKPDYKSLG